MPRVSDPIDDTTPLGGARIDVAARIGWLLRTHRTVAGLSLRQMSLALREQGVSLSAATLSRIESEGQRPGPVLDGYATVLGLPDGFLRSAVGGVCRSFSYAPSAPPEATSRSLEDFSRACEAVGVASPTAGAWLEFARQHAREDGFGLPRGPMEPLLHRLANEVGRGVASARFIRVEALTVLLHSPYDEVVGAILRSHIDDPDHQNFYDLASVLSDRPDLDLLHWAGELLGSPSIFHVRGGSFVLQAALVAGGLGPRDWTQLVPHLERAWRQAADQPESEAVLRQLAGVLPAHVQERLRDDCEVPPSPPLPPVAWSRERHNVHYAFAASIARDACRRRGHPDEPLLARLLFESFFEPRGVRMSQASWVLAHSAFATDVVRAVLGCRDACPDRASHAAALRVAALCHAGEQVPEVDHLLGSGDPADLTHALTMVGRSGEPLPDAALGRGLAGDETVVRQTLYCLGMAGDPRLTSLAADESLPAPTRRAAAWWIGQGARILV